MNSNDDDATSAALREAAQRALAAEPRLTAHGYGTLEAPGTARGTSHARERAELAVRLDRVARLARWLVTELRPTRNAGRHGSYGLKHVYEAATGEYVTNGELILAALAAGYPVKPDGPGHPNAGIGVRTRDVNRVRKAAGLEP